MMLLRRLWALPVSLLALPFLLYAWPVGVRIYDGCIEVTVIRLWPGMGATTLGHVLLFRRDQDPFWHRAHEHIHVEQCERWGPLMPALYLLASLYAVIRGRHYYRDNFLEIEAYRRAPRVPTLAIVR